MEVFTLEDELDHEILDDLKEEIFELYEASLQNLVELELSPTDSEMHRALFRSVHTIKGDLGLVGFTPMIEVLQYLEDILDLLRKNEISYSNPLHDLVIRLLDIVTSFVDECVTYGKAHYDKKAIDATSEIIKQLTASNPHRHEKLFRQAIATNSEGKQQDQYSPSKSSILTSKSGIFQNIPTERQIDFLFFRELMRPIEKRIGLPEARGDAIAGHALYINSLSSSPIEKEQLALACYIHNYGLGFLPENIINSKRELTEQELKSYGSHVYESARLLQHLPVWKGAHAIVMQHQERQDGSGFPQGIASDKICEGAKLLAIIETYINLTVQCASNHSVMSEIDAIIFINKTKKQVFSGRWLRLFNKGMTKNLNQ